MISLAGQVCVLEDDTSVRRALCRLLNAAGLRAVGFASVQELLDESDACAAPGCVVADIRLAEGDSLELPGLLSERGKSAPVIFITATDTPESRERARCAGAAAYFRKPVDQQALLDAIAWVMSGDPPRDLPR